jgi:hypothetical protein
LFDKFPKNTKRKIARIRRVIESIRLSVFC